MQHISQLPKDGLFLLLGKTHSGKSMILKYIMYQIHRRRPFDFGISFSKTYFNGSCNFVPKRHQYSEFKEDLVIKFMEIMKQYKQQGIEKHAYLILDDMIGSVNLKTSIWDIIATQIRHYNISVFITSQYIKKLPPILRSNVNIIFATKIVKKSDLDCMFEEFGVGMDRDTFKHMFEYNTQNYNVLVIDNTTTSNDPNMVYSRIKSPEHLPDFVTH